ncbi:hypothetical protein LZ30DRAFT_783501 [Colletotrichum cereale]|nr:hypothetical protein LZ30DRAFT_783501 [Colletotrichum cereale]
MIDRTDLVLSLKVHQIQSGQVIVDLCSVVKELVENSIDAGASSIDVRFKNQGLDSIEVQDNGSGISPDNYETVALKHYTSKLSTYSDLGTLQTFGFRGEALSSLSALSQFSIVTCMAKDVPKGTKLDFESSGKLKETHIVAAQKGTNVIVENLFHNLPVRRRELQRNIKREWNKVIALLNQYACIQTGVKFSVSQQPTKGKRIVLFSTKGNPTTRENLVNIFGAKTMTVLVTLDLALEFEPTSGPGLKSAVKDNQVSTEVRVQGYVSRPAHGEGRQTPDRQMFFVNGRPCGLPQFAKVFNEVYKAYNASQSPFIFADIQLDTHLYDVNVSPDKRTIMLHDQNRMLESLKEALASLFQSQDYSVPAAQQSTLKAQSSRVVAVASDDVPDNEKEGRKQAASLTLGDGSSSEDDSEGDGQPFSRAKPRPRTRASKPRKLTPADIQSQSLISRIEADDAEEVLSLIISKSDFARMTIVGQFNLGFIIAVRNATRDREGEPSGDDELFIIDQHASDEKYNFERLQLTTVVQSQRLVHPKQLELTALEEEIVVENISALDVNGFKVSVDSSGNQPVGSRCKLLALPLSRETTFTLSDLEELISLLGDHHLTEASSSAPRPSKVRSMFAMRACRSSVMIGKALAQKQMEKLIRHMGELDKPWNCPHGRPTMRHLSGLGLWDDKGWKEAEPAVNWAKYAQS